MADQQLSMAFSLRHSNRVKVVLLCYLALLHVLFGMVLWKSDFLERLQNKFGSAKFGISKKEELSTFYKTMRAFHFRIDANIEKDAVLFIGDSITQGLCVSCLSDRAVNFGIGWDTTYGVLNRMGQYQSVSHAKAVVLAIGVNDLLWRDNDAILKNYAEILKYIPDATKIILSPILPVDSNHVTTKKRTNARIQDINKALRVLCAALRHCNFLAVGKLSDQNGDLKDEYHTGDGIHLNAAGYRLWGGLLKTALSS